MKNIYKKIATFAALPLLIPLIAMQFTDEVQWGFFDFIFAWVFFTIFGITYYSIAKKIDSPYKRALARIAIILAFLVVWVELAVGIF